MVTVVPIGRDDGLTLGAASVGARFALICTVVNDGLALAAPYGTSATSSLNRSVVDVAKCGAANVGAGAVAFESVTFVGPDVTGSSLSSTCVQA